MNTFKKIIIKIIIAIIIVLYIINYKNNGIAKDLTNILIASFIAAYILNPVKRFISKKVKIKSSYISLIIILSLLVLSVLTIIIVSPIIYREINNLGPAVDRTIEFLENIEKNNNISNSPLASYIYSDSKLRLTEYLTVFSNSMINFMIKISENLTQIAVVPVVTYYFLADSKRIVSKIITFVPLNIRHIVKKIIKDSDVLLEKYIAGQIVLSVIVAVITFAVLVIFKVKFSLILSLINGIFNVIPFFGPILGAIPIIIVSFLDSVQKGIYVTIAIIIIQQLEGNILCPKITGESTDIHPIIIILLLLVGEQLGGFIGMILAVPIGVIIKVIYQDIDYYIF